MIGPIAGDVIGSVFEWGNIKAKTFSLFNPQSNFTDDTVLTVAVADSLLNQKDYTVTLKEYGRKYPNAGFGDLFTDWLLSDKSKPYNSYGNGSAMRVSPVGFAFENIQDVLREAKKSAEVTHNHPEGIKGAQATVAAVFLARKGSSKKEIKDFIAVEFKYDLSSSLDELRPTYSFNETCQKTVPQAIIAFLESKDYEDAVRNAISLGGDSDTLACIAGGIAGAYYKTIPQHIVREARKRLPDDFLKIIDQFNLRYGRGKDDK